MSPDAEGGCIMQHAFFLLVYESDSHGRLFGTIHNCHEKNTLFFFSSHFNLFQNKTITI